MECNPNIPNQKPILATKKNLENRNDILVTQDRSSKTFACDDEDIDSMEHNPTEPPNETPKQNL